MASPTLDKIVKGNLVMHDHSESDLGAILDPRYLKLDQTTPQTTVGTFTFPIVHTPTINGGILANNNITIQGTTHSTRTTSYVILQPNGGNVGIGTTAPTNQLSFTGQSAQKIWMERHTTANTIGNSLTIQAGGATVGATNRAGGTLSLSSGIGTGNPSNSNVVLQTYRAGSSGTRDMSVVIGMTLVGTTNSRVIIGNNSTTTSDTIDGLNFLGTLNQNIYHKRHTTTNTAGNILTITAGGATSGATDKNGGNLYLQGGLSTGTGESGVVLFGCVAGATGTADRTQTAMVQVLGNKIGFFTGTPIVKQSFIAYTADNESGAYTGIDNLQVGNVYAQLTDLNALRVAYENLRAAYEDLKTKLVATTLVATA